MLFISEWLPNPAGNDAQGEWIELVNEGGEAISTLGWKIMNSAGKKYVLPDYSLEPGEYLVLPRSATKLTLRNTDERLALHDPAGERAQESWFAGSAPEGKSLNQYGARAMFAGPTPGAPNAAPQLAALAEVTYPIGIPLHAARTGFEWTLIASAVGACIAGAALFIILRNAHLSHLFLGGND